MESHQTFTASHGSNREPVEGGIELRVEQALHIARVVDADAISDVEAAELIQHLAGCSAAEAVEFVSLARDQDDEGVVSGRAREGLVLDP